MSLDTGTARGTSDSMYEGVSTGSNPGSKLSATEPNSEQLRSL